MSGIHTDETGSRAKTRLSEKCRQVLKKASSGFASVTTFSHGPSEDVHSYLHFVQKESPNEGPNAGESAEDLA